MMKIPMPVAIQACRDLKCKLEQLEKVIIAVLEEDTSSEFYRTLGKEKFDIDNFLVSKSPSELMILRSAALSNVKTQIEKPVNSQSVL